jgi:hypothetical protein
MGADRHYRDEEAKVAVLGWESNWVLEPALLAPTVDFRASA